MPYQPIIGRPVRFPPGRVVVRLIPEHRRLYRHSYARYGTILEGLPILREDRDFDGRPVRLTQQQLDALNRAFSEAEEASLPRNGVFEGQEAQKTTLFKRLQYLS